MSKRVTLRISPVLYRKVLKEANKRHLSFGDTARLLLKQAGDNTAVCHAG